MYKQKADIVKMREEKYTSQRIEPDRKWFGNIRTIKQKELDQYRAEIGVHKRNPM